MVQTQNNRIFFSGEPTRFDEYELKRLLEWAHANDVSDVTFRTSSRVWVNHNGYRFPVTQRELGHAEVSDLINIIYGPNGASTLLSGEPVNPSYSIKVSRHETIRFRVNGVSFTIDNQKGISITIRTISSEPMKLSDLGFNMDLIEPFSREMGLCFVTGETGSGKSTLNAAIIRYLIEQPDANLSVHTFEAPIEYVFDNVVAPTSIVAQYEIPTDLKSFSAAAINALRCDPNLILIGESRDLATIEATMESAKTGHLTFTTLHTNDVSSTIRRIVDMFPESSKNSKVIDIIGNTNIILTQRLVPGIDGKRRVALQEYLIFTNEVREQMFDVPIDRLPVLAKKLTAEKGQTFLMDATKKYEEGRISKETLNMVRRFSHSQRKDSAIPIAENMHIQSIADINLEEFQMTGEESS